MWTERLPHPLQTGDPGRVTAFLQEIWGELGSPYPFLKETFETWWLAAIYRACAKQFCGRGAIIVPVYGGETEAQANGGIDPGGPPGMWQNRD